MRTYTHLEQALVFTRRDRPAGRKSTVARPGISDASGEATRPDDDPGGGQRRPERERDGTRGKTSSVRATQVHPQVFSHGVWSPGRASATSHIPVSGASRQR